MKNYTVKIKSTDLKKTIRAKSELEAGLKFCKQQGLLYRVYCNKLEVVKNRYA